MNSEDDLSKLEEWEQKMKQVKHSKYSIPIYVVTIFVVSLWLIFMNPCLMNIILPILAILIPYKLYGEEKLKKIVAAGAVVIILLSVTTTMFQLGFIYDQPEQILNSENLKDGTVEPLYGDSDTTFNFTVNVTERFDQDWDPEDYTVYTNLTLSTIGGITREPYEGYEMKPVTESNSSVEYYREVTLEERLFGHRFSIRKNVSDEMTHLFSLDREEYEDHLNEGTVNATLRNAFEEEGHDIDENAELFQEDEKWFVYEDGERKYRIKMREEELRIHDVFTEEEGPFYSWERTSVGYGPVTIERTRAFQLLVGEYIISTSVIYIIGIGLLWWKKRMDSSVEESTEGLKEKEKELEDNCPDCGTLLKGSDSCEECGWERGVSEEIAEEEPKDEDDKDR